jgi:hypothetical protein
MLERGGRMTSKAWVLKKIKMKESSKAKDT